MAIDVRHITKSFANYTALKDVSLRVDDGELVALLGPSGSGKTTLLRIIAGLEAHDPNEQSSVHVDGNGPRVGFVFQHYALFRHMTVFENVAFGLRVRPRRLRPTDLEIRRRVDELLDLVQLIRWADRYPSQLSGGQRQRIALARALAIEPSVLLLDEPFGALDARVRQELRRWLRTLHARIKVTTVLVTHDQEEALEVADRVVIMNEGRIEQAGTPDEVFHNPASEFVVTFLGNVNLFHGRVESVDAKQARVFVRPHELDIEREQLSEFYIPAKITRIQSAGPVVRVELVDEQNQEIAVDLTHDRHRHLALKPRETVFVKVREARVFVPNYEI